MRVWTPLVAVLLVWIAGVAAFAQETVNLISAANATADWRKDNGQEFPGAVVDLSVDSEIQHNGKPSLRLRGDFTKGGNYVQVSRNLALNIKTLSMWVRYPDAEKLTVRIIDGGGQCHQIDFAIAPSSEWQRVTLPVVDFFAKRGKPDAVAGIKKYEYWGGANDGRWHGPAKSMHVLIGKTEANKTPTLWLSDVQVAQAPAESNTVVAAKVPLEEVIDGQPGWTFSLGQEFKGAKGSLTVATDQRDANQPSLKLAADFTEGGAYVETTRELKSFNLLDVSAIRLKIKSTNARSITVRLIDGSGQVHQKKGVPIKPDGAWNELVIKPADIAGGEHWGGKNDGKWHGAPALLAILINPGSSPDDKKPVIHIADAVAEATVPAKTAAASYAVDFEKDAALPTGWETSGAVGIETKDVFKGKNALVLAKSESNLMEKVFAISPSFPASPGMWEIKLASRTELTSMDSSYSGTVGLECLDAGGKPLRTLIVLEQFRKNPWRPISKQLDLPAGTASARFRVNINKETPGRIWLDELSAAPLVVAQKDDRIKRLMFTTSQLGNLLFPADSRVITLTVWSDKPLPESQRKVTCVVRDYWGAEQAEPLVAAVEPAAKQGAMFVYEGKVDLAAASLQVGRYYEVHGEIARGDEESFKNYTSLAVLPEAPANRFKPEEIPFTSRNWDNRVEAYIRLTHRLGIRVCGVWGGWNAEPPYEPRASQIELVQSLGMGVLTGTPAHAIEQRSKGWEKYDEKALREGVRNWIAKFGHVRPLIFNLGNEPHNKGDAVEPEIEAYRILYDEIKKIDPTITVVGTSSGPIEDYFKGGFGQWSDAYDFHVYEDALGVRKILEERYPALFAKYGHAKPVWSTELGLNSQGLARLTVAGEVHKKFVNFFAGGGASVSWFGLLYPDSNGTDGDSFGSAHNVFDCRYNKYAPKLDAIAYFNSVNAILNKNYLQDKRYGDDAQLFLFRDEQDRSLIVGYKGKGREDLFVPLPGVNEVEVIRIDGSRRMIAAGGKGITLTLTEDPVLLLYEGTVAMLPESLERAATRLGNAPASIIRTEKVAFDVLSAGTPVEQIGLQAPPFWKVEKSAGRNAQGDDVVRFTLSAPLISAIRDADMVVTLSDAVGKRTGELYYRPAVTGAMSVELAPVPIIDGKPPAVKVTIRNNSPQKQEVSWDLSLTGEQAVKAGQFGPIDPTDAYFADTPSGIVTIEGKSEAQMVVALSGADPYKIYRARATAKDASGRVLVDERPVAGFVGVPKAEVPVNLDGNLDEGVWKKAAIQRVDKADQFFGFGKKPDGPTWENPRDLSADIQYVWDEQYLYIGVKVTDDLTGPVGPETAPWQQDGLQFLIDPMRTSAHKVGKYDYALGDRPTGAIAYCYLSADSGIALGEVKDIRIAVKRGAAGTGDITYEVSVPWKCVAPFKPAIGANLGFTMILNEDDGAGRNAFMTWFGNAHNKDIDKVGDLILLP